ncbi:MULTISPECIES: hypothetical protein [Bacillales]|uniref:hypothetical protein n=1 Tax=Bacillales TaxID=1385 RepID=UPI000BED69F6|nr:hypothetical protein [Bacillus cereus]PED33889.1 hypothetical protein CON13_01565 [Bacillus cereus]PEE52090.1 hypothetical protein COM80_16745 [Bacillus cereus]PFL90936.1 hypothetical protein COJ35_24420 [Bacillus cereus]PFV69433.1 hypothetical protein COL16_18305 [Bacillus cereus]PGW01025.1 hypothetical protein COD87_28690 [Bacillus cereus]
MLKNKRKYDVVTAARVGHELKGEYIALVPAFSNGYVYARTYAPYESGFIELLGNIEDLIKQAEQFLLNSGKELPQNIELLGAQQSEIEKYLPYDELDEDNLEAYHHIKVITLYVE